MVKPEQQLSSMSTQRKNSQGFGFGLNGVNLLVRYEQNTFFYHFSISFFIMRYFRFTHGLCILAQSATSDTFDRHDPI